MTHCVPTRRPIERYHNEIRENLKAQRGLGNDKSAQDFANMLQMYHNFIKPHMGLNGKTPAEVAGMDTDLGENKLSGLISKSADTRPCYVAALGNLVKYVDVINDGDSIRIIPKTWMPKKSWHEIDDILRNQAFSWVSFNKHIGCWALV